MKTLGKWWWWWWWWFEEGGKGGGLGGREEVDEKSALARGYCHSNIYSMHQKSGGWADDLGRQVIILYFVE
jgi:hypothetical protein